MPGDPGDATTRDRRRRRTGLPSAADFTGITVGRRDDEPSLLDGLDSFGSGLPDELEERYTPPPPPPLPRISSTAILAIFGLIGGFVLFLFPRVLPIDRDISTLLGFTGIVAGFVTLILRLRAGGDEDDIDPDDGAVV